MAQYGRPDSDIVVGVWTSTPLYQKIDEVTPSDTDYINSGQNNTTCEIGIGDTTDPTDSSGHVVRVRSAKVGLTITLTAYLFDGSTQICSFLCHTASTTLTTTVYNLTSGEADNITDYTDLRLKLTTTYSFYGSATCSWAEFECPDAGTSTTDNQGAYLEGTSAPVDNQACFLTGHDTGVSNTPAYLQSYYTNLDNISAFLQGDTPVVSSKTAWLEGKGGAFIDIIKNKGVIQVIDADDYARALAYIPETANIELYVHIPFYECPWPEHGVRFTLRTSSDWSDVYTPTTGYELAIPGSGFGTHMYLYRIESGSRTQLSTFVLPAGDDVHVRFQCSGYDIRAKMWAESDSEPSWTIDFDDTASGFTTAGRAQIVVHSIGDWSIFHLDDISYHSPTGAQDIIDKSLAYSRGSINIVDSTIAYLYGHGQPIDNTPAYLEGYLHIVDSIYSYTRGKLSNADNSPAFTHGEAFSGPTSSQAAFAEGSEATLVGNQYSYLVGSIDIADNTLAFLHGVENIQASTLAFLRGRSAVTDNQIAFLEGALGANDDSSAFLQGQDAIVDNIPAYLLAGTFAPSQQPAFLHGEDIIVSYVHAYANMGLPSSSTHAFTKGSGLTVPYIILEDSTATIQKKFKVLQKGYGDGISTRQARVLYTAEGKPDLSIRSGVPEQWMFIVRVKGNEVGTSYGDLDDLVYLYELNDPDGSPSNVIRFVDHWSEEHYVHFVGNLQKRLVASSNNMDNNLYFVKVIMVEV